MILIICCLLVAIPESLLSLPVVTAKVVYLHDGDTARVDNGLLSDVRIACIDAPEVPRTKKDTLDPDDIAIAQYKYGRLAQARISNLLATTGGEIQVFPIGGSDRYGRNIASVRFQNGLDWGEALVTEGLAQVYEQYADAGCNKEKLLKLQAIAKTKSLGLWSEPGLAPWEFRKR